MLFVPHFVRITNTLKLELIMTMNLMVVRHEKIANGFSIKSPPYLTNIDKIFSQVTYDTRSRKKILKSIEKRLKMKANYF